MEVSRRNVLLQGAAFGAGVIASNISGMKALAAGQLPERRTLEGLAWNDPVVSTFRDGVGQLKQRADGKPNWVSLAAIHGSGPGAYHLCPHGNWYLLPWHRAYILTYERFIRELTKNSDFALPYWDWTANPTMPEVFLSPTTPDGKTNWLYVDDQDFGQTWRRTWPADEPMPSRFVGPAALRDILHSADYEQFASSRPLGQSDLDPSWIAKRTGAQGILERMPHNIVHNNIGAWMSSALSPRDPMFFMHHCNIDRIWALWNSLGGANSTESLWTDMAFTNNFLNTDGSPFSPKVSDLLSLETLGYTYGLGPSAEAGSSPNLLALQTKLTTLWAGTGTVNTTNIKTFTAALTGQEAGTVAKPLSVSVKVDPALIAAVAKRRPVPTADDLSNFSLMREHMATGARALVFLRDVVVTHPQHTECRVFLDHPGLTATVPVTDPSYVGGFGVFVHGGHGDHAGADSNPSFVLDLTGAIQRLYGSEQRSVGTLEIEFIPVPNRPDGEVGTVRPDRIEVVLINA